MEKVIEYQPIVDEFIREQRRHSLIFCSPRRKPTQRTISDLQNLHLPDATPLEAEWTDAAGYHRVQVVGAWESESGSVVLTVGTERVVSERGDGND